MSILDEIVQNIKDKNFEQTLKFVNKILVENKHIIYNFKGIVFLSQNNFVEAEINFLKSIKISNTFIDPLKNLFILNDKKRNLKKILEYAEKLLLN